MRQSTRLSHTPEETKISKGRFMSGMQVALHERILGVLQATMVL